MSTLTGKQYKSKWDGCICIVFPIVILFEYCQSFARSLFLNKFSKTGNGDPNRSADLDGRTFATLYKAPYLAG